MWWKTCGQISLGRGVMCGLQRLWYTLWQAPHANSQKSTHLQHKAARFVMMIKISPMVWLCSVCCTVLLLCNCCWMVSACTFPKVQVGNPWERRKFTLPSVFFPMAQTSLLVCHDRSDFTSSRRKLGCCDLLGETFMKQSLSLASKAWAEGVCIFISPPCQCITWLPGLLLELIAKPFVSLPGWGKVLE